MERSIEMMQPGVRVLPVREEDLADLVHLARDIWYKHYPSIITVEQIEYMLAQRYSLAVIRAQLENGSATWLKLILDGAMVAFACHEPGKSPDTMKLDKLYVRNDLQNRGYGSLLLRHVEGAARAAGCTRLELQVNKNNRSAIEAYLRNGFTVRAAAKFDIGGGFCMDDYVMAKNLSETETNDRRGVRREAKNSSKT